MKKPKLNKVSKFTANNFTVIKKFMFSEGPKLHFFLINTFY
jgi:hypothetical protein